jgi:hypothetical protein
MTGALEQMSESGALADIDRDTGERLKRKLLLDEAQDKLDRIGELVDAQPSLAEFVEKACDSVADKMWGLAHAYRIHVWGGYNETSYKIAENMRDLAVECLRQVEAAA